MRKLLLITLLSLITTSIFCAGYTQYNDTGHPSSLPSLVVELKSDGNTLGFGFSSTDKTLPLSSKSTIFDVLFTNYYKFLNIKLFPLQKLTFF